MRLEFFSLWVSPARVCECGVCKSVWECESVEVCESVLECVSEVVRMCDGSLRLCIRRTHEWRVRKSLTTNCVELIVMNSGIRLQQGVLTSLLSWTGHNDWKIECMHHDCH